MANDEHIAQLKKGVGAWNEWREANPDIRPDLEKANLRQANLHGAKPGEKRRACRRSGQTSV